MSWGPGKHPVGRPKVAVPPEDVVRLRDRGLSWRQVARELGIGTATAMRLVQDALREFWDAPGSPQGRHGGAK